MVKLEELYDYFLSIGFTSDNLDINKNEDASSISYIDILKKYLVTIVFPNDDYRLIVVLQKVIENYDRLEVLEQINNLNSHYSGVTFFIDDEDDDVDLLSLKCVVSPEKEFIMHNIEELKRLTNEEFNNILKEP